MTPKDPPDGQLLEEGVTAWIAQWIAMMVQHRQRKGHHATLRRYLNNREYTDVD